MTADDHQHKLSLTFDAKVYSLTAVKKAAYRHLDAFATHISVIGDDIRCELTFTPPVTTQEGERLANELRKEVLDQDLRQRLYEETEAVRNVILAHTFSKAGLFKKE